MTHLFYTTAKTFSLLVPVFILHTLFCHAGQFTWTGAVSSQWANTANWAGGGGGDTRS